MRGRRCPAVLSARDVAERGRRLGSRPQPGVRVRPRVVVEAYALQTHGPWAGALALLLAGGGAWTVFALTREVRAVRARRRQRRAELLRRAPLLPGEEPSGERLVVLEGDRPEAWWLSHASPQLVITTSALRRLKGHQLDALIAHEQGHARARHDLLLYCASALAAGFPQVPVFAAFRDQVHRLVELAADDVASRRFGRRTIALALVELNEDAGCSAPARPSSPRYPSGWTGCWPPHRASPPPAGCG